MKKIAVLLVLVMLLAAQQVHAADLKIGVVDLIKALNESNAGKKAKTDLEALIKSKQTSIDEKGKEIEKLRNDLEKQASVLSTEARKTKEEELERLIREYQRIVTDSQTDVKKRESEFTSEILKDLRAIIEKIGQEGAYTMIIENAEGIVLYSKPDQNLTETVIKKYNETKTKDKDKK
ncbi:MAG: OmpH family outer membrane protein [Nitrospirae bacterium]|nr:OmpH family outer membrane protein [Nitrospirota bacterium]